jgi:peptidoglycan/xylan/chitin deacetylase (PgdA/CDA1 family)
VKGSLSAKTLAIVNLGLLALTSGGGEAPVPVPARPGGGTQAWELRDGAVIRGSRAFHRLALVFTAHEFAESAQGILDELARHKAHASFFLTGDFLANTNFDGIVRRIVTEKHYIGPHSDKHLQYLSWDGNKPLVSQALFRSDLEANLAKIEQAGVDRRAIRYFLPPYEHYDESIARWSRELGLMLVNFTPGTRSSADYMCESDKNFVSSQSIFDSIVAKEKRDGLAGFILLLHLGSGPCRVDKFSPRFGELLDYLAAKNYELVRIDRLLEAK